VSVATAVLEIISPCLFALLRPLTLEPGELGLAGAALPLEVHGQTLSGDSEYDKPVFRV